MAGAHVEGSPFRVLVVAGAAAANASFAYGAGIASSLAGGAFGTSVFTIRRANLAGDQQKTIRLVGFTSTSAAVVLLISC